jgi:glycosyltransferase involved in cell wall biosynthesis
LTEKQLNIGFDAKRYFQNKTGLGNYSHYVIDGLASLFPALKLTLFSPREEQSTHQVVWPHKSNFMAKFWRISGLIKEPSFENLSVYHGLSNELPWRNTKVKTVVTVHDIIFKHLPQTQHPINRWIYNFKTQRACKLADKIVATSHYTKKDLVKFYGVSRDKIEVVYQDCHPQFYNFEKDGSVLSRYGLTNPYLLCVGTLEERKCQLLLIQAFEQSNYQGDLVLVGQKTNYFLKIEAYLKDKQELSKRVKFVHSAAFKDFPSLYAHAEVFVYPSVCEGFGIPTLEAMNVGVPVITTSRTVLEEVCQQAAIYFEKRSLVSLTKAIDTLASNSALKNELVAKGKERALYFRKEKTLPQLLAIYKNL